jgi:sulfatase modifying factor 1
VANKYGLYNMHGNVEEWCQDWYGAYASGAQTDPVGRESGDSKVTRGGSHSTMARYLTSSNRSSSIPTDRNWMIGFRVALGKPINLNNALPREDGTKFYQQDVTQTKANKPQFDRDTPYYKGPQTQKDFYVRNAYSGDLSGSNRLNGSNKGPFYRHNHQPAIAECPNGDLLAIWYTGSWENRRELNYAVSRKPYNQQTNTYGEWSDANLFFDTADRNNHGAAILSDGETLYSICGQVDAAAYGPLVLTLRTSNDNGATWADARIITPEYEVRHQAIGSAFVADNGDLVLTCDACSSGSGGTALWISKDQGQTWTDAGAGSYDEASSIKGIHASVVDLTDDKGDHYYMGLGRSDFYERPESEKIPGVKYPDHEMSMSITYDEGKTYTYSGTGLIGVESGQRLVLRKLDNGNLLLVSFTGKRDNNTYQDENKPSKVVEFGQDMESYQDKYIELVDETGTVHKYYGAYAAISEDGGKTWPYKRFLTDITDDEIRILNGYGNTKEFKMTQFMAEPKGYLTGIQTSDGLIHVLSSAFEYTFNEAWVKDGPADLNALKMMVGEAKKLSPAGYTSDSWVSYQSAIATVDSVASKTGVTADEIKGAYQALHDAESALVKEIPAKEGTVVEQPLFSDVSKNDYFHDAVQWAVDKGITSGTGANTFSPNASCTRGQMVTFLWRAAGSPTPKSAKNPFTDVSRNDYFYNAVLWAAEQGITSGTSASSFSPNDTVNRGQTVTFLWRTNGSPAASGSSFGDVASNTYYAKPVSWAVSHGITAGTGGKSFSPNANCTRAQIVTFLYREAQ